MESIRRNFDIFSIVIIGFVLRIYSLGNKSLWIDEAEIWDTVSRSFDKILLGVTTQVHPPLYCYLTYFVVKIAGDSEFTLRSISLFAGTLFIIAIYILTKIIRDRQTAIYIAILATTSPFLIMVSQEARMYSLLVLLAVIQVIFYYMFIREGALKHLIFFILSSLATVYTHHLGWLLLVSENLYFFILLGKFKSKLFKWILVNGLVFLGYLPLLENTMKQIMIRNIITSQLGMPSMFNIVKKVLGTFFYFGSGFYFSSLSVERMKTLATNVPELTLFLFMFIIPAWLVAVGGFSMRRTNKHHFLFLFIMLIVIILFGAIERSPANHQVIAFIPYIVFLGMGIKFRATGFQKITVAALGVLWLISLNSYYNLESYPLHQENWKKAVQYLNINAKQDDIIYVHSGRSGYFIMNYYYQGACRVETNVSKNFAKIPKTGIDINQGFVAQVENMVRTGKKVWFVYNDWNFPDVGEGLKNLSAKYLVNRFVASKDLEIYLFSSHNN